MDFSFQFVLAIFKTQSKQPPWDCSAERFFSRPSLVGGCALTPQWMGSREDGARLVGVVVARHTSGSTRWKIRRHGTQGGAAGSRREQEGKKEKNEMSLAFVCCR